MVEISSFCTCVPKTTIIWGTTPEIRSETDLFCHIGQFFALLPPKNTENQNFEEWKTHLEISSFYSCVPQMKIIWCTVPDIWSTTHNFLSFWTSFFPFYVLNNQENQNFEKIKTMPEKMGKKRTGDIIILHTVPKIMITMHDGRIDVWMDRQTDRKSDI